MKIPQIIQMMDKKLLTQAQKILTNKEQTTITILRA
jgi:hypothetical protein